MDERYEPLVKFLELVHVKALLTYTYGMCTHKCLGFHWMELQLAVNGLMIAHSLRIEVFPANCELRFNSLASIKPSKNLKFGVAEKGCELHA